MAAMQLKTPDWGFDFDRMEEKDREIGEHRESADSTTSGRLDRRLAK